MPSFTSKTMTSLSRPTPLLLGLALAFAAAAALVAAGCGGGGALCPANSSPANQTVVECVTNGGVQVASGTLPLPARAVPGLGATTCLTTQSTCANESVTSFASDAPIGTGGILFGIRIAPTDAPATYPLAGDTQRFSAPLVFDGVSYSGDLTVTSGTLVIKRNDAFELNATFDAELQTTDGLHQVSLTGGTLHIGSCRIANEIVCVTAD
jgi:hypothetical protein